MANAGDSQVSTPQQFIAKWRKAELSERGASQEHFIDLCRLLAQPTPAEHDAAGADYAFELGVSKTGGGQGFADVAHRGKFAWEYKRKGKHATLEAAYSQLLRYHDALDNPPLLIVSDIERIEIHTKFPGTAAQKYSIPLAELDQQQHLDRLRKIFTDPEGFRPKLTLEEVTGEVAGDFAKLADALRYRGYDPHDAAHFLMKCMFCFFAEDVGLLPGNLFTDLIGKWRDQPDQLTDRLTSLFRAMKEGDAFGADPIEWFNGELFDDAPALTLNQTELGVLLIAGGRDWSSVDPTIFGTLFERSLDPGKRSQIGAHYTRRDDILKVVEPVVMRPIRRRWEQVQQQIEKDRQRRQTSNTRQAQTNATRRIQKALGDFVGELSNARILDPACGSGNFLYVAIQQLLALEKEVITRAAELGVGLFPQVRPTQLHGIEINPYAAELAQVVIWIGYLQWMRDNGFNVPREPILAPLQTIEQRDAILSYRGEEQDPKAAIRADWPEADYIIGNPPFLGSKLFREYHLPDPYIEAMYQTYDLPNSSDLCCYWFERARQIIEQSQRSDQSTASLPRVGLLATQGIRGGTNRRVLERIKDTGELFMAWDDEPWVLDGAAVHVSIIGFTDQLNDETPQLDGKPVQQINANLTGDLDLTVASNLPEDAALAFMGDTKVGPFDIDWQQAQSLLEHPNPQSRGNNEVVRPWINGRDVAQRWRGYWIVDFAPDTSEAEAATFEAPYEYISSHVRPMRRKARSGDATGVDWWIHQRPRPDMREALEPLERFIVTTGVAKHRVFTWMVHPTLPDHAVFAFARSDDYFFGVLHSAIHELWALRMGTQLEDRPRYTPTTCFETFPLPWPPGHEPGEGGAGRELHDRIAEAAADLVEKRQRWLNPPEWIEPWADAVDRMEDFSAVPEDARPLLRQSAIQANAAQDPRLKKRTLTKLYNDRPAWLQHAHATLDRAVLAAYRAVDPAGDWNESWAETWQSSGPGQPLPDDTDDDTKRHRAEADRAVLANLLRLNQERSE